MKKFEREEMFNYYQNLDNPFIDLTIKLDVTKIVDYCKEHKGLYASIGYIITKAVNNIDNFKFRLENNSITYYDVIRGSYAERLNNGDAGFFDCPDVDNYFEHLESFKKEQARLKELNQSTSKETNDVIWISSLPWFSFTGLVPPFTKDNTIPQFIWDKVLTENNHHYVNLLIHIHHGLADGYHIHLLLQEINRLMAEFPNI